MDDVPSPSSPNQNQTLKKAAATVIRKTRTIKPMRSFGQPGRPKISFDGFQTEGRMRFQHAAWGLDWFVGTLAGQLASLMVIMFILIFASMAAWRSINLSDAHAEGDDYEGQTEWAAVVWFCWNLLFDSGTAFEGLSPSASNKVLITAGAISIIGFVFNLTLLGFVVRARKSQGGD
jgi:hypothetical protein